MAASINNLPIRVAAFSHRGRRENNEDSVYGATYRGGSVRALLAVADGMGGHQAGEVASTVAVDTLVASLKNRLQGGPDSVNTLELTKGIVTDINQGVAAKVAETANRRGMGTTLCFALVMDEGYFVGNVGDSRAYLIRGEGIHQITHDHTVYFEMIRSGRPSELAARHPYAHHITRSIVGKAAPVPDAFPESGGLLLVEPGDVLLLCTDGLVNTVREQEIVDQVRSTSNLSMACHNLASLAYLKGGTDNISVVAAEVGDYPRASEMLESLPSIDSLVMSFSPQQQPPPGPSRSLKIEILNLALLIAYLVFFIYMILK
jgi:protein phosphatase